MKYFQNLPPNVKLLFTALEMGAGLFLTTSMIMAQSVGYNIFDEVVGLAPVFTVCWFLIRFSVELLVGDGPRQKHP
jgi:hypothetical protein